MRWVIFIAFLSAFVLTKPTYGIEMNGAYDTTAPTSANIPNWNTGWPASNVTGWNYVGHINGASGVYLGNGWVLTAGHVGSGNFTLNGITYTPIPNTAQNIAPNASNKTSADLTIYQIASPPNLPPLTLSSSDPVAFSATQTGSTVAMLGYGGSNSLTWGLDTVTEINQSIDLTQSSPSFPYITNDFYCDNGTVKRGASTITNNSNVVLGDSGGADFIYNVSTKQWELAGINEITDMYANHSGSYNGNGTFSGFVQLDTYAAQINAIYVIPAETPTLPPIGLLILACLLFLVATRSFGTKRIATLK